MWKYEDLFKLNYKEFEQLLADLWKAMGYDVTVTGGSGDQGVDLVAVMERGVKIKVYIQAKCYAQEYKMGAPEIREYASLILKNEADCVVVICTSGFTAQASKEAQELNIRTIDGHELVRLLNAHNIPSPFAEKIPDSDTTSTKVQAIPSAQLYDYPFALWNSVIRTSFVRLDHVERVLKVVEPRGNPIGLLLGEFEAKEILEPCILFFTDKELFVVKEAPPSKIIAVIGFTQGTNVNVFRLHQGFSARYYADIKITNQDAGLSLTLYKIPFAELKHIFSRIPGIKLELSAIEAIWDSLIRSRLVSFSHLKRVLNSVKPLGSPIGLLLGKFKAERMLKRCIIFFTDKELFVLEDSPSAKMVAAVNLEQNVNVNAIKLHSISGAVDVEIKARDAELSLTLYGVSFDELVQILSKLPNIRSELPAMKSVWDSLIRTSWVQWDDLQTIWPYVQGDKPIGLLLGKWPSPFTECLLLFTDAKIYVISRRGPNYVLAIGNAKELWRIVRINKPYVDIMIKDNLTARDVRIEKVDETALSKIAASLQSLR